MCPHFNRGRAAPTPLTINEANLNPHIAVMCKNISLSVISLLYSAKDTNRKIRKCGVH